MPNSIRPGDVLADRYDLVDLLVESGGGRFWRAHDRVLDRHVALHVLAADDERAEGLLEAARQSATVQDRRLLRVLDADRADGVCYVVNEWGAGTSLDTMLAADGPMPPRRAAWLVSEVAACVTAGHAVGVAHGRLVPENVLVDGTGSVRLIGYSVDAALHGLPPGRLSADVADLGGLLYCALTGRWTGVSRSGVPGAPEEHGRVLRPRQVRAGIPRSLDQVCDQLLNAGARANGHDRGDATGQGTPAGLAEQLRRFVGDPAGLAADEARLQAQRTAGRTQGGAGQHTGTSVLPAGATMAFRAVEEARGAGARRPEGEPTVTTGSLAATRSPGPTEPSGPTEPLEPTESTEATETTTVTAAPGSTGPTGRTGPTGVTDDAPTEVVPAPDRRAAAPGDPAPGEHAPPPREATDLPTQAGMPVFDDERDEVSWLRARSTPAPPPPPFEVVPERPLFAPEPAEGQPARKRRPTAAVGAGGDAGSDFWPWDTGTGSGVLPVTEDEDDDVRVPGRRWLRLALVLGLSLVLLVVVVVVFNLGRGRTPLGAVPDEHRSTASSAPKTPAVPISGLTATDLDPQGDPPEEYPELTALAVDGDPSTAWHTSTYDQNFGPAGLKTGVGLVVDLGAAHHVSSVDLTFVGAPTSASLFLSEQSPTSVTGMSPVAKVQATGAHARVSLAEAPRGRYLTIWLTSLPAVSGGFRGEVAEVAVRG